MLLFFIFILFLDLIQGKNYKVTHQIYFDISINGLSKGRITIGLFGENVPKTVKNFYKISTVGINNRTYAGSKFHRVINRFMIQGGDIVNDDGTGSISIYGKYFEDENFQISHSGPGFVSMANSGVNQNGCQFFITTMPTTWLDGKHVVFGKVLKGQNVVHIIEHEKTDQEDRPLNIILIEKSGRIKTTKPFYVDESNYELIWAWINAAIVPLSFTAMILTFFYWVYLKLSTSEKVIEDIKRGKLD